MRHLIERKRNQRSSAALDYKQPASHATSALHCHHSSVANHQPGERTNVQNPAVKPYDHRIVCNNCVRADIRATSFYFHHAAAIRVHFDASRARDGNKDGQFGHDGH